MWIEDIDKDYKAIGGLIATMSLACGAIFELWKSISVSINYESVSYGTLVSSSSWQQVASSALYISPIVVFYVFVMAPLMRSGKNSARKPIWKVTASCFWVLMCGIIFLLWWLFSNFNWDNAWRTVCVKDVTSKYFTWTVNCSHYVIVYQWDRYSILKWNLSQTWWIGYIWEYVSVPSGSIVQINIKD